MSSTAFSEGQPIPEKYTCDGQNVSPPLAWSGAPENAKSIAVIVDDPDVPSGTFAGRGKRTHEQPLPCGRRSASGCKHTVSIPSRAQASGIRLAEGQLMGTYKRKK